MSKAPEGLDWLIALEEIKRLRAVYCRSVDSRDWPRMASILADDFVLDMSQVQSVMGGPEIAPVVGKSAVMEMFEQHFSHFRKILHIVTIPEIEFQDGENATGVWRQETYVKENRPDLPGTGIAYATVFDIYRKQHGQWLFTEVRVQLELIF